MRRFTVLPLLFAPVIAWGDCTEHLQAWASTLHPQLELDIDHAVCKINPADTSQLLGALPLVEKAEALTALYGLDVLVADAASGKILAHAYERAAIESDAFRFTGLALDTARYQVAPGKRAFGVRITHEGSSRVNPSGTDTLSLYLKDGSQLQRIMNKLVVNDSNGEWDGGCTGEFSDTTRTLAMGKPGKNDFVSLLVRGKTTERRNLAKGEDCEETGSVKATATFTLDYDGNQYEVPKALQ